MNVNINIFIISLGISKIMKHDYNALIHFIVLSHSHHAQSFSPESTHPISCVPMRQIIRDEETMPNKEQSNCNTTKSKHVKCNIQHAKKKSSTWPFLPISLVPIIVPCGL